MGYEVDGQASSCGLWPGPTNINDLELVGGENVLERDPNVLISHTGYSTPVVHELLTELKNNNRRSEISRSM